MVIIRKRDFLLDFENMEIEFNEQDKKALHILSKIVKSISADAEIRAVSSDNIYTIFEIIKADSGIIIGKHGHTLDAIQYLVNLIVNQDKQPGTHKIYLVDINGYRKRREESLKRYVREKAEIAKRKGESIPLYFMNSIERRIVHMALKEDSEITTYSEGQEPYRKIIIKPLFIKNKNNEN